MNWYVNFYFIVFKITNYDYKNIFLKYKIVDLQHRPEIFIKIGDIGESFI